MNQKRRVKMIKQKKQFLIEIFFLIFFLFVMNIHIYPYVIANRGDYAFDEEGEKGISIKSYIIKGAGYFLSSYSDWLLFLNKVEMSELNGIDYKELSNILYRAIENMENAKEAYYHLKQTADNTPYNQAMINHLLSFDYHGFKKERGFNNSIFKGVKSYLRKGDVRGFFARLLANTENILRKLYIVKESVDADTFPGLSTLWGISQDYSRTMLFGQYAAEMFNTFLSQNCK
jgi:hypothetical protein